MGTDLRGCVGGHVPHGQHQLRQREDAPLVESDRHRGRSNALLPQLCEGFEEGVQLLLLRRRSTPHPFFEALSHHLPRVLWKEAVVVPEVEPPVLPPLVRRRHDALDVQTGARLLKLKRAAASPQGPLLPALIAGGHLHLEEVELEVPMGGIPRYPSHTVVKTAAYMIELGLKL